MKDLYICTGQFHVFCSFLLKIIDNKNFKGDIIICDCFDNAKEIYSQLVNYKNNINEECVFDDIYILDESDYNKLKPMNSRFKIIKIVQSILNKLIKPKNKLKKYININEKYSRIYIAGVVPSFIEYCIYEKTKYNTEIILFDDGLGSRIQWKEPSWKLKIFDYRRELQFWNYVDRKVFFSPDHVYDVFPHVKICKQTKPVSIEINKIGLNYDNIKCIVNKVFEYKDTSNPLFKNNIIYFSSGFDLFDFLKQYSLKETQIINEIGRKYNDFVVKKHPNSKETYDDSIIFTENSYIPEIAYLNTNVDDKLLISAGSSTIFNPSFIYGMNPYIILTYKLFSNYEEFIERFFGVSENELNKRLDLTLFSKYNDKTKISIPNTFDELFESINYYVGIKYINNKSHY